VPENQNDWILETENSAYTFGFNKSGMLVNSHWGKRLAKSKDYPEPADSEGWASFNGASQILQEEYPVYGGMCYQEPNLKITFSDHVRDIVLAFDSADCSQDEVTIKMRDVYYPLKVELHYRAHFKYDLIERWAVVNNVGSEPFTLERIFSAQWHFPVKQSYFLSHLTGRWNDEFHLIREPLNAGVKILESRRLTSSHHHNPWFAVDAGDATETQGNVWAGMLAWSGNWKLTAEVTNFETTRLGMGINDWDFAWKLSGGESFATPSSFGCFSDGGFGGASRKIHDFIRDQVIPHGPVPLKVMYNSWEATLFDVNEVSQSKLAEIAASIGVELFVMDDGWFKGRKNDSAGLGDWWADPVKFPNGLQPLINHVNQLGMDFGLWLEPEMVNPDSDLYRSHPDWIIHFPTRQPTLARNQYILNLAKQEVQEYLIEKLDALLEENRISFIKWDMNRNVSEPGWTEAPGDPREIWVRYVQGLYRVWGEMRRKHPDIIWQSCSGGGGRADLGILHYADQIWVSDNTGAEARLQIQHGFSQAFPANTMEAWVTDADRGRIPLAFRFHVSMCGSLGIGGNLLNWSEAELSEASYWIKRYKDLRDIIQLGDQYRLDQNVIQYMSKDGQKGVLLAFCANTASIELKIKLQGLDPQKTYLMEGIPGVHSGSTLMSKDMEISLFTFESTMREIHQVID
jgi:alpha-galactosidase